MKNLRSFHTTIINCSKIIPNNLKNKSVSSQHWLTRQLNDPYVERARQNNYRCRSAFKLLEINKRHNILRPGQVIVDCGAAPGSWTQVAVEKSNSNGTIESKPKGCVIGNADFTSKSTMEKIQKLLDGRLIDIVLSDMAPKATGVRCLDQENITKLCYSVLRFAILTSSINADILIKIWDNADAKQLETDILRYYKNVKSIKPAASRGDSSEKFILGRNFIGIENVK